METANWLKTLCPQLADWQIELIVDDINETVAAEREACASLCDRLAISSHSDLRSTAFTDAAELIRERSKL